MTMERAPRWANTSLVLLFLLPLLLSGCPDPKLEGSPCGQEGRCPPGLACEPCSQRCVSGDAGIFCEADGALDLPPQEDTSLADLEPSLDLAPDRGDGPAVDAPGDGTLLDGPHLSLAGTCQDPRAVTANGTFEGNTAGLRSLHLGSCGGEGSPEAVFHLSLEDTTTLTLSTETSELDTVLYVRRGDCAEGEEVDCNDNAKVGERYSTLTIQPIEAGDYFILVDGAGQEGAFTLTVTMGCEEDDAIACDLTQGVCAGAQRVCDAIGAWQECDYPSHSALYEGAEASCNDGQDNDCDGLTDCEDDDCFAFCPDGGPQDAGQDAGQDGPSDLVPPLDGGRDMEPDALPDVKPPSDVHIPPLDVGTADVPSDLLPPLDGGRDMEPDALRDVKPPSDVHVPPLEMGTADDVAPPRELSCKDGIDNDGDGDTDCEDLDCDNQACGEGAICFQRECRIAGDICKSAMNLPLAINSSLTLPVDPTLFHDDYAGSCGGGGDADGVYRFSINQPFGLNAMVLDADVILYLRRTCEAIEVACNAASSLDVSALEAGEYYLFVDGLSPNGEDFTLQIETYAITCEECDDVSCSDGLDNDHDNLTDCSDPDCSGRPCDPSAQNCVDNECRPHGDTCLNPIEVSIGPDPTWFNGDAAGLHDDYASNICPIGDGAPDVVYLFSLDQPASVNATVTGAEAFLYLRKTCDDVDLACDPGSTIHSSPLEAGSYHLFVDGLPSTGSYTLEIDINTTHCEGCSDGTCSDRQDNDGDGAIDCLDSGCEGQICGSPWQVCQGGTCICQGGDIESLCGDAMDNDCDGLIDCSDPDCADQICGDHGLRCSGTQCTCPNGEPGEQSCGDGQDNDCDGLIDCGDSNCTGQICGDNGLVCSGIQCLCPSGQPSEQSCGDTMDNDCDGLIDCEDWDCADQPCGPGGVLCQRETCGVVDCGSDRPGYCLIEADTFSMGSPVEEPGRYIDETPHQVTLTRPYYLKAVEVTQAEWEAVFDNAPSNPGGCADCPVTDVSWWDTVAYTNELSRVNGLTQCYTLVGCGGTPGTGNYQCTQVDISAPDCPGYRLPTEAEWEYAVRAGTINAFSSGEITHAVGNCLSGDPNLDRVGWYCWNNEGHLHPVALKETNDWGLHDMHGNALEWVWDAYDDYPSTPVTDPLGPLSGEDRVYRGGGWRAYARECRSAFRGSGLPSLRTDHLGFRMALTASPVRMLCEEDDSDGDGLFACNDPDCEGRACEGECNICREGACLDASGGPGWALRVGGISDDDQAGGVAALPGGGALVTGTFYGSSTVGSLPLTTYGEHDIFVAKVDPDGNPVWAMSAGGMGVADKGTAIATLPNGSALVTGAFGGPATFGPIELQGGAASENAFVARYNPDGTTFWAKEVRSQTYSQGRAIAALPDASVMVAGIFSGQATFGRAEPNETILNATGLGDIFLARYNPNGTLAWARQDGGANNQELRAMVALPNGSAVVMGIYSGDIILGEGDSNLQIGGSPDYDIFIARYHSDGTLDWATTAMSLQNDDPIGLAAQPQGLICLTGSFRDHLFIGATTLFSAGGSDIFTICYSGDGSLAWAAADGGLEDDAGRAVALQSDGSLLILGEYRGEATFGEEANSIILSNAEGTSNIALAQYNGEGRLLWARGDGGVDNDYPKQMSLLSDGTALVIGAFHATTHVGDSDLVSAGANDVFVVRYQTCPTTGPLELNCNDGLDDDGDGLVDDLDSDCAP